jgi:L-amino acid N-acyltransferase YncA
VILIDNDSRFEKMVIREVLKEDNPYLAGASRGNGIGKTLLQRSMDSARVLGYRTLYL